MSAFWIGVIALALLGLVCGLILGYAAYRFRVEENPLTNTIDALLPQSQCGQCGYPGCKPYAEAIAHQGEMINKCIPGGEAVMLKIADTLGVEPQPMDGDDDAQQALRKIAVINESDCIGCTKCIQACPVDAIIGTNKAMHTVVSDLCTGCDLCIAPCPTDCISMQIIKPTTSNWKWQLNTIPVTNIKLSAPSIGGEANE
jgi:electron transport complex protein RnfB